MIGVGVIGSLRCAIACVVGVGFGWCASACGEANVFVCASDQQCGADGQCESTGFCSFPDGTCTSGRRYGGLSGELAGDCVDVQPMTGTDESGPVSMSTSSSTGIDPITEGSESAGPQISASEGSSGETADTSGSSESSGSPQESTTTGPSIERVVDGLVVLYTFQEGGGDVVQDVSGVEPPIDLTVMGEGYEWTDEGLVKSNTDGILLAEGSATKILQACQATEEITLEAWVTPADAIHTLVPARVLTYSLNTSYRNFTLGQTLTDAPVPGWVARLRTTDTTVNGLPPLEWESTVAATPTHVVFTHAADGSEQLWVDAMERAAGDRTGSFEGWDPDTSAYHLALGNELTLTRNWNGTFHLAAIYDRALSADEVQQNYDAGY